MASLNFSPLGLNKPIDMHDAFHEIESIYQRDQTHKATQAFEKAIAKAHKEAEEQAKNTPEAREKAHKEYEAFKDEQDRELEKRFLEAKDFRPDPNPPRYFHRNGDVNHEHLRQGTIPLSSERVHGDKG